MNTESGRWAPGEEQGLLAESVQRWCAERYAFDERRRLLAAGNGFSAAHWREFGELGWLAAGLPEAAGGLGGGALDNLVVAEALGAGLWCGPWLECVVMAADLLARSDAEVADTLLPGVVEGSVLVGCAFHEAAGRYDTAHVETRALRDPGGWRLQGAKSQVAWATVVGHLLVSARTEDGVAVFVVPTGADGVGLHPYATIDGRVQAELTLTDVALPESALLFDVDEAAAMIGHACDRGAAALVAEAAGGMWRLYETTLAYLRTRKQFGVALGSLQALQHRMVEMYADCEMARSMAWVAANGADAGDATERARAVSAAKSRVGKLAVRVGQESVQLHGGMGMTDELPVGHYFKRLTAINATLGDAAWHAQRYARLRAR